MRENPDDYFEETKPICSYPCFLVTTKSNPNTRFIPLRIVRDSRTNLQTISKEDHWKNVWKQICECEICSINCKCGEAKQELFQLTQKYIFFLILIMNISSLCWFFIRYSDMRKTVEKDKFVRFLISKSVCSKYRGAIMRLNIAYQTWCTSCILSLTGIPLTTWTRKW